MTIEERLAELEAENALLREHVRMLADRVHELEARLAKDSHNSSKHPPATGSPARRRVCGRVCDGAAAKGRAGRLGTGARHYAW